MHQPCVRAIAALLLAVAPATAQGRFVNYEDPQIAPIAVADLGNVHVLLVCNTPDNSLEIYQTTAPYWLIARVPVGLSPVTVRWNPANDCAYTADFLGDSVSRVRLGPAAITPGGTVTLAARNERTSFVGDEPTDIAFAPAGPLAFVTLHKSGGLTMIDATTLQSIVPFAPLDAPSPLAGVTWGVKAPRRIALLPDGRTYVLNTMGGEIRRDSLYDFGLYTSDPTNPPAGHSSSLYALSGLGSSNFGFAIDGVGRRMFVVSQIAKNQVAGVDAVAAQPTGFVQTWLQIVDLRPGLPGDRPQLVREQTAGLPIVGTTKPLFRSINLNRDYSQVAMTEVAPADALAQATDVALIEDVPGIVVRVALAAFGSDKVALLTPDASQPSGWLIQRVAVPMLNTFGGYSAVGPRGLAYDATAPDPTSLSRPGMLFVLNRLDNSLAVVNPWTASLVFQRALGNDPTPPEIRAGRRFLYSAFATSGNGAVSCSSCHVDARTEGLGWRLGSLDPAGPAIPPHFHDGDAQTTGSMPNWPNDKPITVTQTLQGLVNYLLEPFDMQFIMTNAPYHWRGDRLQFQDFNDAFVRLQHRSTPLTNDEMDRYTKFVNTIHHAPNPEQSKDRTFGGTTGNPDDPSTGSGALLGRKLFHIVPMVGPRSCVQCHHLPEGSSNTLTIVLKQRGSIDPRTQVHPFETAATRSIFVREMVRTQGFAQTDLTQPITITAPYGLLHAGIFTFVPELSLSINDFVHRSFFPLVIDPVKGDAVTRFLREFDSGTAPAIGLAATIDPLNAAVHTAVFDLLEQQAREANVGVAVHVRGGVPRGYWFDVETGIYVQEGTLITVPRGQLLLFAQNGETVWVEGTPTISERRVASVSGTPAMLTGAAPSQLRLLPMVPDTAFAGVTDFTGNWDPNHSDPLLRFNWDPAFGPEPVSLKSQRTLQTAVLGSFGVPTGNLRHEAPRRFRVSGQSIRHGARLGIELPSSSPNDPPARTVWFDLVATRYRDDLGRTVWETAEELDPLQTMAWLCGGYWAPGVRDVLYGTIPPSNPLAPGTWNRYVATVQNEDGTTASTPARPLVIADVR
jgi:DNA-binding beta-propeller fold protein YncE